jgi:hypothetical protein
MKSFSGRPFGSVTACSLVFNPPLVRPIRRPRRSSGPLFRPQARSRAMCRQVLAQACSNRWCMPAHIDHHRLRNDRLRGQSLHLPDEEAPFAAALEPVARHRSPPSLPAVIRGLGRAIARGASHHRKPLRLMKIILLKARRSATRGLTRLFGKNGFNRSRCASVSEKRSFVITPVRSGISITQERSLKPTDRSSPKSRHDGRPAPTTQAPRFATERKRNKATGPMLLIQINYLRWKMSTPSLGGTQKEADDQSQWERTLGVRAYCADCSIKR